MRQMKYFLSGRLLPCALALALLCALFVFLAIRIPQALAPAALGERLFCVIAGLFVLNSPSEKKPQRLFLLLFLPWLGAIYCLFPQRERPLSPEKGIFSGVAGCVSALSRTFCGMSGGYAESAEYFRTGKEMSLRLLKDLNEAKREIFLDYYILARGAFFDSVLKILERKAGEGVDVRLVYDDFGCAGTLPKKFYKTLRARGIRAKVFRPMRPLPPGKLNRRDHKKLTVIDGRILYAGGVNLADEYIGEKIRYGHWKDSAIRVTGGPAAEAAAFFKGERTETGKETGFPCVYFTDRAESGARTGEKILCRLISSAEERLFLCTPYLVPTPKISEALTAAALGGADVRLMIPHIPDKKLVFLLTRNFARRLSASGVKVREYAAGFLHAKSLVADGKYSFVGSYNLDERSLSLQAENGIFAENFALAEDLERDFLETWETGLPLPKASLFEKVFCFLLRPLISFL